MKKITLLILTLLTTSLLYSQEVEIDPVTHDVIGMSYDNIISFSKNTDEFIFNLDKYSIIDKDYVWERDTLKEIAYTKWDSLNNQSKDILSERCIVGMDTIVSYYMSKGLSQNDATMKYLNDRIVDVQNAAKCFCDRINNPKLQMYVILFLGEAQASTFNDAVRNFKSDLCSIALLGTQYGDSRDGIMDYIESTGSYTSGGLKSYTMSDDMVAAYGSQEGALAVLIQILHNLIIKGE